jgi:PPK2 family polyphosphate:nucleotide phosphotransferase
VAGTLGRPVARASPSRPEPAATNPTPRRPVAGAVARWRVRPGTRIDLGSEDPGRTKPSRIDRSTAEEELAKLRASLDRLQELFYADGRRALLIILQGMDASGKDSTIRHVFDGVNPQGVHAVAFKAPTEEERAHDFLWREHAAAPRKGAITIFNRSYYEGVLVAAVHRSAPAVQLQARYRAINELERELVDEGTTVLKFFLHMSREEQGKRLRERLTDPSKQWKLSEADRIERGFWSAYMREYQEVLRRTSTPWAPWYLVPSDHGWYRNWVVGQVVVHSLEAMRLRFPPPKVNLKRYRIG